jgi:hypothetical protein
LGINYGSIYGTPVGGTWDTGLSSIARGQGTSISEPNYGMMAGKQVAGQFGINGIWPVQSFMGRSQMATDPSMGVNLGLGLGTGLNLVVDPNNPAIKLYNPLDPALKGLGVGMAGGSGGGSGGASANVVGKLFIEIVNFFKFIFNIFF